MKRLILGIIIIFTCLSRIVYGGIVNTKHNLSVSGPGPVKSTTESQVCIFCHTPHNTSPTPPLWNRDLSYQRTKDYIPYSSPTIDAASLPGQPRGESRLCLSCHDGTVALGQVLSRSPQGSRGGWVDDRPASDLSLSSPIPRPLKSDLSGNHPISFAFDDDLANRNNSRGDYPLYQPSAINDPQFHLDQGKVECTSCHDVHDDSNFSTSGVHFWRKTTWSGVCNICHNL